MSEAMDEKGHEDILAMELAFGLLDKDERRAAEARLDRDAGFAADHARWAERATGLFGDRAEPVRPSLWPQIERQVSANDRAPPAGQARGWKLATLATSLAAAGLLATILLDHPAPQILVRQGPPQVIVREAPPKLIVRQAPPEIVTRERAPEVVVRQAPPQVAPAPWLAVLTGTKGGVALAISVDRASGRLTLAPARLDLGRKVPELWVIPAGGVPHALGLVPATLAGSLQAPPDAASLIQPGATLAVSKEPAGGSPTGQPTGPVILTGTIAAG